MTDPFAAIIDAAQRWRAEAITINDLRAVVVEALNEERARALRPFRDLEDGYPLGSNVPIYRISRAIEEVER